jgi:hypothetical protein
MSGCFLAAVKVTRLDVLVASGKVLLSSIFEITAVKVVSLSSSEAGNS